MEARQAPQAPMKQCASVGCAALTLGRYCVAHQREWQQGEDRRRGSSTQRYGPAHRRLQPYVLARDPICKICGKRKSEQADHVLPVSLGGPTTMANLQGVCGYCNAAKGDRGV
jgi:5-methylcytosine-specific restriction endonuclease McrA